MYFGENADACYRFVSTLGFAQWMLQGLDESGRAGALDALRRTITAHATDDGVLYDSAAWIITATRS